MSDAKNQSISLRLAAAKVELLDDLAKATDRPRTWHVEQAIEAYLEVQAWQLKHIAKGVAELEAGEGIPQEEIEAYLETWGIGGTASAAE